MPKGTRIKSLLNSLREDEWRRPHPFSEDILTANKVLLHPFAYYDEREAALTSWFQRMQPCLFGRVAAAMGRIHYCILTDADLRESDNHIYDKIRWEKKVWKQLAVTGGNGCRHSFFLLVVSDRVFLAAPDNSLKALAEEFQRILTGRISKDIVNNVGTEQVYLRHPQTGQYHSFPMNLDFFASAGDGRWWHDHRIPAGIGFSLNSIGHMVQFRDWFSNLKEQEEWALKTAMLTIDKAYDHPEHKKATWLITMQKDSVAKRVERCPFSNLGTLPAELKGKDWTAYHGAYHTDHSVRGEFFLERDSPLYKKRPLVNDFSYIFSHQNANDVDMMHGEVVSEESVFKDVGNPNDWRVAPPRDMRKARTASMSKEIRRLVQSCSQWNLTPSELRGIG